MHFSVIIPMYNEEKNVERTALALLSRLRETKCAFEIIFSDDGSVDRSAETVARLSESNPEVRLLRSETNRGKGYAVRKGITESRGDYAVFTDCDLAYGAEPILEILTELRESNAGICIGSRSLHPEGYGEYSLLRRTFSKLYIRILKTAASFNYSDSQCGIKGFNRQICVPLIERCVIDGFAFDLEILMLADSMGIAVREVPVRVLSHVSKDSKVKMLRDAVKMLRDLRRIKKNINSPRKELLADET
ncbi:MAG: glycosyltransferase [Clostridia bacterium]|nr:glycosyltransferase [Clostridia bacterium]